MFSIVIDATATATTRTRTKPTIMITGVTQSHTTKKNNDDVPPFPSPLLFPPLLSSPLFSRPSSLLFVQVKKCLATKDVGILLNNVGVSYSFARYFHELTAEEVSPDSF